MSALLKIRNAGFQIEIDNGDLLIEPGDKLTNKQVHFLKIHKAVIITELQDQIEWVELPEIQPGALTVICLTPNGKPIEIEARDEEHAAWLQRMNPPPIGKQS